ncbi:cytochrome aa3 controlling protein [Corynebacterium epidermidicanis]|uniref:Cytochrome aa3 controlling protein n=2 Tax=Corynebacterium epidermidicanis TaxID=1050174 RepID=A0A0G3GWK0_9CORY|nr:COX15/CtaA family protein [Corynebacterium epidermidicanis]AKK03202.1 cytochrome aa3 controlling protein [Corynebacterium epidermidicanis]
MKNQARLAMAVLISQIAILVTGSIVRVTGSGLGCDTWPNCHQGSLVPVQGAAPWIHQIIEFGNRGLAILLGLLTVALIVSVYLGRRRPLIKYHAWAQFLGVVLQAVIGGISVHLDLRWWAVAIHFLPSMVLVWLASQLYVRIREVDEGTYEWTYLRPLRLLAIGSAAALAVVLVTGTMVTGAGVHSGDSGVGMEGRLEVDIAEMAHIHAHFMYLYLGLTLGLVTALIATKASQRARKLGWYLVAFIVIQGAVGIIQYWFHIPRWTVPFHVGLSGVVTAYSGLLYAVGKQRR